MQGNSPANHQSPSVQSPPNQQPRQLSNSSNSGNSMQQQQQQQPQRQNGFIPGGGPKELSKFQYEKFMRLLQDFMNSNGTPLTTVPSVAGRKINLFGYYFMVMKLGGFDSVKASNRLPVIATKLGIPPNNNVFMQEFTKVYESYLLPLERHASTPEGNRDIQIRNNVIDAQMKRQYQSLKAQNEMNNNNNKNMNNNNMNNNNMNNNNMNNNNMGNKNFLQIQ
ncbi:unnamed protein product [[Candida] boidinii]|nr:unnamed protein product [[Candida] boidinii]